MKNFKICLILILYSLLLSEFSLASQDCAALFSDQSKASQAYKKFKSELAAKPRVSITRFSGSDSFHSRFTSFYDLDQEHFLMIENPTASSQIGHASNETFLDKLQAFPLSKMTETGYITPSEAKMFQSLGTSLETSQINFFEVSREASDEELQKYPKELLRVRQATPSNYASQTAAVTTATLWSVAGQVNDHKTLTTRMVQLPWEKEEARKGQALDRRKYKYVWEWGRAAQDIANEIAPIYAANAATNYIELIASGGRLEEAYVMFHSFDRVNTRLYLSDHPGSSYPADAKDPNDMLFLVPLAEMLKRYPPSHFSAHVAKIISLSDGKIGEVEALNVLVHLRILRWKELDSTGRIRQKAPIILNDLSGGRILSMLMILKGFDLSEAQTEKLMDYLVLINPVLKTQNVNQKYENSADSVTTSYHYHENRAVEISNIDPKLASQDSNYVMQTIFESYIQYLGRFSNLMQRTFKLSKAEANHRALDMLIHHKVKFGVTSSDPEVQTQCEKLNPAIKTVQKATQMQVIDHDLLKSHPEWFRDAHIYIFDLPQIISWVQNHPEIFSNPKYEINPGFWQSQYFSSQIDIL